MSDPTPRGNGTEMVPHDSEPMPSLYGVLARAAQDPSFDLDKFQALLQAHREMKAEQAQQAFYQALNAAQSEMRAVFRNAANQQTNSRYATLELMDDATRPIYTKHGFSLTFSTAEPRHPENIRVVCTCSHEGGHRELYELEAGSDMTGAQGRVNKTALHGLGSTLTYLRRYLFMLVWNIVLTNDADDDDGNAGGISAGMAENARRPFPPAQPPRPTARQLLADIERDAAAAMTEEDMDSLRTSDAVRALARLPETHPARVRLLAILTDATTRLAAFWETQKPAAENDPLNEVMPPDLQPGDANATRTDKIITAIQASPSAEVIDRAILGNRSATDFITNLSNTGRMDLVNMITAAREARIAELGA